jgi:hypothetical protein
MTARDGDCAEIGTVQLNEAVSLCVATGRCATENGYKDETYLVLRSRGTMTRVRLDDDSADELLALLRELG